MSYAVQCRPRQAKGKCAEIGDSVHGSHTSMAALTSLKAEEPQMSSHKITPLSKVAADEVSAPPVILCPAFVCKPGLLTPLKRCFP